jgi:hypothetical protein
LKCLFYIRIEFYYFYFIFVLFKLGRIPCECQESHARLTISIKIEKTDFKSLFNYFSEINKFILTAEKKQNNWKRENRIKKFFNHHSNDNSNSNNNNTTKLKSKKNKILIYGINTLSQYVVCACAQYMMLEYEMSAMKAIQEIANNDPSILNISDTIMDDCLVVYLKQFESYVTYLRQKSIILYNSKFNIDPNYSIDGDF